MLLFHCVLTPLMHYAKHFVPPNEGAAKMSFPPLCWAQKQFNWLFDRCKQLWKTTENVCKFNPEIMSHGPNGCHRWTLACMHHLCLPENKRAFWGVCVCICAGLSSEHKPPPHALFVLPSSSALVALPWCPCPGLPVSNGRLCVPSLEARHPLQRQRARH